ncbi:hypothetical protein HBI56_053180 [Parastagonospora nodorum]|uniref:Uncharacterized protein n=1 Tax=Phaeosphaeria nodorum (strain SN15 / ATCC MYA-4574 / FGSC 10173) TaxID=321614 RepID=A0A7U2ICM6_PHANO|nr:hypothetical protein HBH56_098970 [Parastagonospora nodorum]QRD07414.1 hypothetical protein JI435_424330 [Parastagonospora nodorum SN15]KAH3930256.1 hypothetical protein HBH54_113290 [Parastagonospora nodorum]KAH3942928.1 hypothetical protein HBH53_182690 [Parastagonospora nodorum]KAH3964502.1 hypothetical protein HBH51_158790 [Parastagonospora nodorum]
MIHSVKRFHPFLFSVCDHQNRGCTGKDHQIATGCLILGMVHELPMCWHITGWIANVGTRESCSTLKSTVGQWLV